MCIYVNMYVNEHLFLSCEIFHLAYCGTQLVRIADVGCGAGE